MSLSLRSTLICASFCCERRFQYIPVGFGNRLAGSTRIIRCGVTMMSTGTSWVMSTCPGGGRPSVTTWLSCTQVTTGVDSSIMPNWRNIPYSSSAKPSPFPTLAPVSGFTAVEPTTTMSIVVRSSRPRGSASCFMPPAVAAKLNLLRGRLPGVMREKKPVRSRGCGTYKTFSASSAATRTDFCGVSGFTLTTFAALNSGSPATRRPVSADPLKLGILWWTGRGKSAKSLSSK
mmetsp:Transcript_150411/g.464119  ORF Transcript_150411/g.464119 Transcript_150411/m.464119 type:complete len:232 (-) Transcript_150411:262-957(-)